MYIAFFIVISILNAKTDTHPDLYIEFPKKFNLPSQVYVVPDSPQKTNIIFICSMILEITKNEQSGRLLVGWPRTEFREFNGMMQSMDFYCSF